MAAAGLHSHRQLRTDHTRRFRDRTLSGSQAPAHASADAVRSAASQPLTGASRRSAGHAGTDGPR